jgi:hypothetical protein
LWQYFFFFFSTLYCGSTSSSSFPLCIVAVLLLLFVRLYTWISVSATNLVVFCRVITGP